MEDLPRVSRAEATRIAEEYANRTVALIGGEARLENPGILTPPCDGPSGLTNEKAYYAAGHYNIAPVPEDQQVPTLRRLREHFQQQGCTIKEDRVYPDGKTGLLIVENPADKFDIRLISAEPPTAFAVKISSPCYYSDEPYPPRSPTATSGP